MGEAKDNTNKDERALEALLAAAFRLDPPDDVSDEEAKAIFQQPVRLSKEDEEAIESWGTDFVEKLLESQNPISSDTPQSINVDEELKQEYFAMNRDKDGSDLDDEARREIDRRRKEILDAEKRKDKDQNNES